MSEAGADIIGMAAAAALVLAARFTAGVGALALAGAVIATTVLMLVEKSRLRALVFTLMSWCVSDSARWGWSPRP